MNRRETTALLSEILYHQKFSGIGKYYASEVTVDYGMKNMCRVDFIQFVPSNQMGVGSLEKGIFICYEIKSCLGDFKSGHGQNYIGEENYLVMPIEGLSREWRLYKILPPQLKNRDNQSQNYYFVCLEVDERE